MALNTKCRNNYFFDVSINFLTEHKRKLDFFYLSGITRKIPPESEIASRDKKKAIFIGAQKRMGTRELYGPIF